METLSSHGFCDPTLLFFLLSLSTSTWLFHGGGHHLCSCISSSGLDEAVLPSVGSELEATSDVGCPAQASLLSSEQVCPIIAILSLTHEIQGHLVKSVSRTSILASSSVLQFFTKNSCLCDWCQYLSRGPRQKSCCDFGHCLHTHTLGHHIQSINKSLSILPLEIFFSPPTLPQLCFCSPGPKSHSLSPGTIATGQPASALAPLSVLTVPD